MGQSTPIEITKTKALEIGESTRNGPRRNVVMSIGNRWFDIRHMTDEELMSYVAIVRH
jgi:hypothetical protein